MFFPRSIFTKLVTVFLVIGLVPFLGMGLWTYNEARERMTEAVIQHWLVRLAREAASQLDHEVNRMQATIAAWSDDPEFATQVGAAQGEGGDAEIRRNEITRYLDQRLQGEPEIQLLAVLGGDGTILALVLRDEPPAEPPGLIGKALYLAVESPIETGWVDVVLQPSNPGGTVVGEDWHRSELLAAARGEERPAPDLKPRDPGAFSLGFGGTIREPGAERPTGALLALYDWTAIQRLMDDVDARFQDPDEATGSGGRYASGYPFLFRSDGDTIIAHHNKEIIGNSLVADYGLKSLHGKIMEQDWGFDHYEYPAGTSKISGFAHTRTPDAGGFDWILGVGINAEDIYADVTTLRDFLIVAALIVTGLVVLGAAVFSHRITRPIRKLIDHTKEIARGNLDARVHIQSHDELRVLGESFNRMAADLQVSNQLLIRAEKDAAWREMARQVAHEIKNPLTPIMLSAQQIERAHADRHPDFGRILDESVHSIIEHCESLRQIATEFSAYASFGRSALRREDLDALVSGAVNLSRPGADRGELDLELDFRAPAGTWVEADREDLRRVFLNVFNNAYEALDGNGGKIHVAVSLEGGEESPLARIDVRDDGPGIPAENLERLFEPAFSTRTGGTGLGLAICRRIMEDHGGSISVESAPGQGTTVTLRLPARVQEPAGD